MKKLLKERGIDAVKVSSAGTSAVGGAHPTDNTIEVMKKEGIDVSGYESSKLAPEAIKEADLILTMDNKHKDKVLSYAPYAAQKTFLLNEFINKKNGKLDFVIPDPISLPMEVYERVFGMIKEAVEELAKRL